MNSKNFLSSSMLVNDYKHNFYLTIDYFKYDFIMNKSVLLEK